MTYPSVTSVHMSVMFITSVMSVTKATRDLKKRSMPCLRRSLNLMLNPILITYFPSVFPLVFPYSFIHYFAVKSATAPPLTTTTPLPSLPSYASPLSLIQYILTCQSPSTFHLFLYLTFPFSHYLIMSLFLTHNYKSPIPSLTDC